MPAVDIILKLRKKHWKYILLTRFLLIFTVLIVFYFRSFLITTTPTDNPTADHQLNENCKLSCSCKQRKIHRHSSFVTAIVSSISTQRKILTVLARRPQTSPGDVNCSKPSILAFPSDGLTQDERKHGWILVHMFLMFYGFWFLASICDDYLVPSIEQICSSK